MKRDITKDELGALSAAMFNDDRYFPIIRSNSDFTKVMQFANGLFTFTFEQLCMFKLEFDHHKRQGQ